MTDLVKEKYWAICETVCNIRPNLKASSINSYGLKSIRKGECDQRSGKG
jgi:hypothetical protein